MNKPNVFYVTGPLHSGKTTRLREWCQDRTDVGGLFQPVIDGIRHFVDIKTGNKIPMEAQPGEVDFLEIGKFRFTKSSFDWASNVLVEALEVKPVKYLIIDEIGPLEMRGEGLHQIVDNILQGYMPETSIVLVIRDYLMEVLLNHYHIKHTQAFNYPQ